MSINVVTLRGQEMFRSHDVWEAINYVMSHVGEESPGDKGWSIRKAVTSEEKRSVNLPRMVDILCGLAAILICSPAMANDNYTKGNVSANVVNIVTMTVNKKIESAENDINYQVLPDGSIAF